MCGGGMVNMTGSNLTGIMETMKFAYHATSYDDFLNLKNQISSANFTYKMSTSMEFSESTYDVIMISIIPCYKCCCSLAESFFRKEVTCPIILNLVNFQCNPSLLLPQMAYVFL